MTEDNPLAIAGTRKALKEMADGTLRVQIDIEPRDKAAFHRMFPEIDMPVAVAPLQLGNQSALSAQSDDYGQQARSLRQSGFFRRPDVWKAVGKPGKYLDWVQIQVCVICGKQDWPPDVIGGRCQAAHVRRAGESGTGYKADYAVIPLCGKHHQMQHEKGELAALRDVTPYGEQCIDVDSAKEWFNKRRIAHVEQWCWEKLKSDLGYDSWALVPPSALLAWTEKHDLDVNWLPECYRG